MPNYTLYYFNGRGRAEILRMMFAAAGVKYTDKRFEFNEWDKYRKDMPGMCVPVLEIDGKHKMPETMAIARYLAREFGFYGRTSMDMMRCDYICDCFYEIMHDYMRYFHWKNGRFRFGGQIMGGGGQMKAGGGQMMGSSGQMMAGSGQMKGSSGQMVAGSGQMKGSGGQMVAGGGQMKGSGGQMMAGSGQIKGSSGQMMAGSGQMKGSSGQMVAGSGQMVTGSGQMKGGSGQMVAGSGQMKGSGGQMVTGGAQMVAGGAQMVAGGAQMVAGGAQTVAGGGQMAAGGGAMKTSDVAGYDKHMYWRYMNTCNRVLPFLERTLCMHNGGNHYFMGEQMMWCDIMCYCCLENPYMENQSMFGKYPKIMALRTRVASHQKIAVYLKGRCHTKW